MGIREASLITPSRFIRRRSTTRPVASNPATLQLFLPRSIPKTAISIGPLPFPRYPQPNAAGWRGGPSHKHDRGWGGRHMRYPATEKLEIIRLVEQSPLPV